MIERRVFPWLQSSDRKMSLAGVGTSELAGSIDGQRNRLTGDGRADAHSRNVQPVHYATERGKAAPAAAGAVVRCRGRQPVDCYTLGFQPVDGDFSFEQAPWRPVE